MAVAARALLKFLVVGVGGPCSLSMAKAIVGKEESFFCPELSRCFLLVHKNILQFPRAHNSYFTPNVYYF